MIVHRRSLMRRLLKLSFLLIWLLSACGQQDETGPVDVRWDRESCARCVMAVSDHNFAAQIRGAESGKRTQVYKFDDIGCAVIWLDQQSWKDDPRTEIWVADHRDGHWIDARTASYVTDKVTPMAYGLGAQAEGIDGGLDFAAASRHVYDVEQGAHKHRGHMHHMENKDNSK